MYAVTKQTSSESLVKGSRFLAELIPCESQAQARDIIKSQKALYADSTHVVHAFIVGKNAEILGMSDDGEPSGTAGRPVLDVLKGSGFTNVILTVTRWFGGTLLGTGGLVKAYGNAAKEVIEKCKNENAFEELIEKTDFAFKTNYSLYKPVKNQFANYHLYDLKEDFGTDIQISGRIQSSEFESFAGFLKEISNGQINL